MVSPVYLHGLFMDNLEVWALADHGEADARKLAAAIHATFWDPVNKRYLVSTQLEQRAQKPAFYPDHVAQVFPLLVGYPLLPGSDAGALLPPTGCASTALNGCARAWLITRGG
jgi:hypothetical protein